MNFSHLDDRVTYYNTGTQLWNTLRRRTDEALQQRALVRDSIVDPAAHCADVEELRRHFLHHIGGLPEKREHPEALVCGELMQEGFSIQKLLLTPREGVRATAHLYRPACAGGKRLPAILFLCGHSTAGKSVARYQGVARHLVANGHFVLILDPTGQGERLNYYDPAAAVTRVRPGTGDHEYVGPQCLLNGKTLVRYMLHDAIAAVDYLAAHREVDASRLGVTGSSGGGLQTSLMLLVEPRLAAAAPATFVTSRLSIFDSGYGQDAEQIWPSFSRAGYDHLDLLLSFAPKPLRVLGAEYDFFPIEGTRESTANARRFWELYGRGEALSLVEDRVLHSYSTPLAQAAKEFFAEAFGTPGGSTPVSQETLPEAELFVTKSGQILGDFPDAVTIFDENRRISERKGACRESGEAFLREAIFRDRDVLDLNLRVTAEFPCADIVAETGFWWSSRGVINSAMVLKPALAKGPFGVTLAIWEDGTRDITLHDHFIRSEIAKGRAVMVLNVSGMGPLEPCSFNSQRESKIYQGSHYRIADDLIFLGDSYAALRTHDVLRALQVIPEWADLNGDDVELYLHGPYGIYGALASVVEPRLERGKWVGPLFSYREIVQSRYYNDRDIKALIIPGLLTHADWTDLVKPALRGEG